MYLLNGDHKQVLEFSDRGFQYGDGLFETIEIFNGRAIFLAQHIQRLQIGCQRLLIPPPDSQLLKTEALQLINGTDNAVLKLIVTRGTGGRGYRQPDDIKPSRLFSLHPYPDYPSDYFQTGISVKWCQTPLGLNPLLAGLKHLNRLEQVMARAEWNSDQIQEGLMQDLKGNVIEGTMSNLFLIKDNVLYTPVIDFCGVEGILKNILIGLAKQHEIPLVEKIISQQEVLDADELFVSNSIIGIWPIKKIAKQQYSIGPLTKKLQSLLFRLKQKESNAH